MDTLRVAISQDLLMAFAQLPRAQQRKINTFITKFRDNPMASGINYEMIVDAANPQYRSVRIDQAYRGIVLKPEQSNVYVLLWVAHHDDAYDWAKRHKSAVNPATGSLQVYEVTTDFEPATPSSGPESDPDTEVAAEESLLLNLRERELRRLGVPEDCMPMVKALRSEAELEAIQRQLPIEAFEALSFIAADVPLEEVMQEYALPDGVTVNPDDIAAALEHEHSQRRFRVVDDDLELQQMLQAPLEQWRVFLHPSQRRVVERHWNGPVRVLGGAGTGKTVVAMHRARWLVRNVLQAGERLLLTTYTRNLAADIEANLRSICSPEEMTAMEVVNLDAWVTRFMKREKQSVRIVYSGQAHFDRCWNLAMTQVDGALGLPDSFYEEEWTRVILPNRVLDKAAYFRVSRVGRGTPLSRRQRASIWPVFEEMRLQLHQAGLITAEDAMFVAKDMLDANANSRPYRCVLVDEAQDFGPEAMQLLRAMAPPDKDDMMIVGDAHQRIYGRRSPLGSCGINIRGRGRRLRINYRTTEQIRRLATAVLDDLSVDDLDDGRDASKGYRSLLQGKPPILKGFEDAESEALWIADEIQRLLENGRRSQDMCVVGRTRTCLRRLERVLGEKRIDVRTIDRNLADNLDLDGIRLANMHRIKGLEFRIVFLVGIREGRVPLPQALATDDPAEARIKEASERALLHVATSRAIEFLYVTWHGEPSRFLSGRPIESMAGD